MMSLSYQIYNWILFLILHDLSQYIFYLIDLTIGDALLLFLYMICLSIILFLFDYDMSRDT